MRIDCPYCGSRDLREFSFLGDAEGARALPVGDDLDALSPEEAADSVYLRANPAGRHTGLWYHDQGCRSWLEVERDTLSHEIHSVRLCASGDAR